MSLSYHPVGTKRGYSGFSSGRRNICARAKISFELRLEVDGIALTSETSLFALSVVFVSPTDTVFFAVRSFVG